MNFLGELTNEKSFTMLELVIVIIVLGIVASIGADIISSLYDNYLKTRSITRLQAQSELILDQISKRLQHRIKDSVIARNDGNFSDFVALPNADETYDILEWIGKDNESFLGQWDAGAGAVIPGWSGFIDLDSNETDINASGASVSWLKSPGSRFDLANITMQALSEGDIDLVDNADTPAIIFKDKSFYDLTNGYGWKADGNHTFVHRVFSPAGNTDVLQFIDTPPSEIYEQYDLTWSAYAIRAVPVNAANNDYNLTIFYNYQPWDDERYDDNATKSQVLASNVSSFRFRQIGETIRVKLCIHDNNSTGIDLDFAFCKERVIY